MNKLCFEWFSVDCQNQSKSLYPITNDIDNTMNQSKLEVIACSKARETYANESRLMFVYFWLDEKAARVY